MKSALLASVAALTLWGAAGSASASEVTYTFSGTVVSGFDQQDLFGFASGTSLAGLSYTVVEDFKDVTGLPGGGFYFSPAPNVIDIDITIGPSTIRPVEAEPGSIAITAGSHLSTIVAAPQNTFDLNFTANSTAIGASLADFSADASNATISGSFSSTFFGETTDINFGNGPAPVSVSTVPLPAGLPLFAAALLGLAGIGYGMRRTGRNAAA